MNFLFASFYLELKNFILDITCQCPSKGIIGIVGESGSGKSTFLNCISGLLKVGNGLFVFNNKIYQNENIFIPAYKRNIGYVFQNSFLFPHFSVLKNLTYGIRNSNFNQNNLKLDDVIYNLGIKHLLNKKISDLSGGEKQRLSIAQSLLINPLLLLMDEPVSSIDENSKKKILLYLKNLSKSFSIIIIYVTHSYSEIFELADYILFLERGRIKYAGSLFKNF